MTTRDTSALSHTESAAPLQLMKSISSESDGRSRDLGSASSQLLCDLGGGAWPAGVGTDGRGGRSEGPVSESAPGSGRDGSVPGWAPGRRKQQGACGRLLPTPGRPL